MRDSFFYDPRVEFFSRLLEEDKLAVVTRLQHLSAYVKDHKLEGDLGPEAINFGALYVGQKNFAECLCKSYLATKNEEKCTYELNYGDAIIIKLGKLSDDAAKRLEKSAFANRGQILLEGEPNRCDAFIDPAVIKKQESKPKAPTKYDMVITLWNEVAPKIKKGVIKAVNAERKRMMDKMFKEFENDHEKVEKMMRHLPNVDWIAAGRVSFYFETIFRNNNFLKFYEEALAYRGPTDEAEDLMSQMPAMQPVLTEEELAERT